MSVVLVASLSVAALVGKYPKTMPLGGMNSAIISAACHVQHAGDEPWENETDLGISSKPLMWGVTIPGGRDKVGHCCLGDREVQKLELRHLYAGF